MTGQSGERGSKIRADEAAAEVQILQIRADLQKSTKGSVVGDGSTEIEKVERNEELAQMIQLLVGVENSSDVGAILEPKMPQIEGTAFVVLADRSALLDFVELIRHDLVCTRQGTLIQILTAGCAK